QQAAENADNTFYIAYAYPIIKGFSAGLSAKILMGNYPCLVNGTDEGTVNYGGFGFDLGVLFKVNEFVKDVNLSVGLNIQDVMTKINWS
ncbi:MAG TPA: hypothetical protein P5511_05920, partial [Candidatus Goldiibacteriota bacterium]|nr:hypothetical protein [Candidatus Goldiibacteriota bacterium]